MVNESLKLGIASVGMVVMAPLSVRKAASASSFIRTGPSLGDW